MFGTSYSQVNKNVARSLSESTSDEDSSASESESSPVVLQQNVFPNGIGSLSSNGFASNEKLLNSSENPTQNDDKTSVSNGTEVQPNSQVKKRPPSPETLSKIVGFEIKEAPRMRISKKKPDENGSARCPDSKKFCSEDRLKRADTLERKYDWFLNQESHDDNVGSSRSLNPYDVDEMDDEYSSHSNIEPQMTAQSHSNKDKNSLGKSYKTIGEQWGSMVTPITEDVAEDSPMSRWPEYSSIRSYSNSKKSDNRYSSYDEKHRRSPPRRRSKHSSSRREKSPYSNSSVRETVTQTTQTPHTVLPLASNPLASSENYQSQAEDLKEVFSSSTDAFEKISAQIKISVLETLEAVALAKEKTDASSICRRFNEVLQQCRQNSEMITKTLKNPKYTFLKDTFLVINMKLISILYHKLYITRRSEVSGAKTILDDFLMKKSSDGEQRVSQRFIGAFQFYATYMEHLAKSHNYSEKADGIIDNCKSDFFFNFNFKEVKSDSPIQSVVSLINAAVRELNSMIEDSSFPVS